jgi:uncharacterized membrane protein HdeD (DUF308 family)
MVDERQQQDNRGSSNDRILQLPTHWGWLVVLGLLLVVLGAVGIGLTASSYPESIIVMGWFLLLSGLLHALHALSDQPHRSLPVDIMTPASYATVGVGVILFPFAEGRELSILLSAALMVQGLFRIIPAMTEPIVGRISVFACGAVSLYLGFQLWMVWPEAGLRLIGLFMCAELAVSGWSLTMRGLGEKGLATITTPSPEEQYP